VKGRLTFDGQPPEGAINLGLGMPSAETLRTDVLEKASESFFDGVHPFEFNYGTLSGDERFQHSLAGFLSDGYESTVDANSLFVTGGTSQGLDIASTVFAKPGDTVFVEEPSYFLAFQIFRDHGLNLVGVPVDENGIRIDALEGLLEKHKPTFVYVIPSYHNPGGFCMSEDRRQNLIELSQKHGFLIVADEVYQLLHYYDRPPPAFGTRIETDTVVSLGSFSKILAPAMRVGWIQTCPDLRNRLMDNGFVVSGGSVCHFASHIVRHAIDLGLQQELVSDLRRTYRDRVEAMQNSLQEFFGDLATWRQPEGGYFFWLRLNENVDTTALRERARALETGFQPGAAFSIEGGFRNYLRLCFAHYNAEQIHEGVARLRRTFD